MSSGVKTALDTVVTLATPGGEGRAHIYTPTPGSVGTSAIDCSPQGTLLLGHGAGGGVDAPDLQALTALTEQGWVVVLLEQPWHVAGRRIAVAPPKLDEAAEVMLSALSDESHGLPRPWVLGGRSAGARVAARLSAYADALVLIAFPLQPPAPHPPLTKTGRVRTNAPSRVDELVAPLRGGIPTLVVQGVSDRFGGPPQIETAGAGFEDSLTVRPYPGDHQRNSALPTLVSDVSDFLAALP